MSRSRPSATAAKPHSRSKVEKRIGRAAPVGDPWAARIRAAIEAEYHPWQLDAANDPALLWSLLTGRGGGKTTLFKGRYLVEMAETTRGKYIYACPTLGMAVELLWEPLKQACSQLGIMDDCVWAEAPREGGKILTFSRTGSRLKLFGADDKKQINLCRGQAFNGVGCDEVGFWPSPELVGEFVEQVIEPRIGERGGWIGLASSPGKVPRGYFHKVTSDGSPDHRPFSKRNETPEYKAWGNFSSHGWSLKDVVALPDAVRRYPALVALRLSHLKIKENRRWSDENPIWMREYEGRWAADNTTTVFRFDPAKNLWSPQRFDPLTKTWRTGALPTVDGLLLLARAIAALPAGHEWHYVLAGDKGSPRVEKRVDISAEPRTGDPYAFNVFAFAPSDPDRRLYHVYFHERTGMYGRPIAQLLLGPSDTSPTGCQPHDKPGGIFGLIGWPDGMVMDADAALLEELSNVYGVRFEKAEKRPDYKHGAIELVNGDLVDGRIRVIEESPLHRQITGLQWAEQDSGALKEDPAQPNHSTDTLIYARRLQANLFDSGVVAQEDAPRAGAYVDPQGLDDHRVEPDAEPAPSFGFDDDQFDNWR